MLAKQAIDTRFACLHVLICFESKSEHFGLLVIVKDGAGTRKLWLAVLRINLHSFTAIVMEFAYHIDPLSLFERKDRRTRRAARYLARQLRRI